MLQRITNLLLFGGALITLGFMARAGDPTQPAWWIFLPVFGAWAVLPYVVAGWVARWRPATPGSHAVLAIAAALLTGFGVFALYQAFVTHLDPQSAIVLVYLPIWQLVGLFPLLALSRVLARRGQPRDIGQDAFDERSR